jgi:hypothetical protein
LCIPHIVAAQRLDKNVTAATNTRSNRRIVGHVVLYAIRVVSRIVGDKFFPELLVSMLGFKHDGDGRGDLRSSKERHMAGVTLLVFDTKLSTA